jgi:hypothetical protein
MIQEQKSELIEMKETEFLFLLLDISNVQFQLLVSEWPILHVSVQTNSSINTRVRSFPPIHWIWTSVGPVPNPG